MTAVRDGSDVLQLGRSVGVSPEEAYPALTSALGLMEWLAHDARVEARVGGRLYLYWRSGEWVVGERTFCREPILHWRRSSSQRR